MAGDYTRLTFDPLLDRAMVLEQQGRVHLDADFNELVSILERRLRVETRDLTGPAVVPATLPDSFKISMTGTKLTIGPGRMYVDGLLAENHGYGNLIYEPVWDEPDYDGWTPIDKQPYLGSPVPPDVTGDQLVYLDVWQREETYVEDPLMLESALGVDTCTRVQTIWQVRTLALQGNVTCADDVPGFPPPPSAARLTSQANQPPAPSDPCAVAPVGGYRGVENRLYRVEIHDGGDAGSATFKWSRDNGAVAAQVIALDNPANPQVITVERLGRDGVLRFHKNEWVELLDDTHELDGQPGLIGQVNDTDPTTNTVTLAAPMAGPIDPARNPRLRRWDQQDGVDPHGVIEIKTAPASGFFKLEDGVEVKLELSDPAGSFKTGDWWVFAARAATASIETLQQTPPRGIRHHYAKLAVIQGGQVTGDCRVVFPGQCECEGDCECTACVTPQSHADGSLTIQDAINKVTPTGGRVCVAPGQYTLTQPLRISRARSLTLAGAGSATLITYVGELGFGLLVEDSVEVSLERFALAVAGPRGARGTVGIAFVNTAACRVERCLVLVGVVPKSQQAATFGPGDVGIGFAGWAMRTRLRENVIVATTAIGDLAGKRSGPVVNALGGGPVSLGADAGSLPIVAAPYAVAGNRSYLVTIDLAIDDNLLLGLQAGIDFAGPLSSKNVPAAATIHLGLTRIADNLIIGAGTAGILLFGLGPQQTAPVNTSFTAPTSIATWQALELVLMVALELGTGQASVAGNAIFAAGDGIRAMPDALRIADNQIVGSGISSGRQTTGVWLSAANRKSAGGDVRITGNLVRGFGLGGVICYGNVGSFAASGNQVLDGVFAGIAILGSPLRAEVSIAENSISNVGDGQQQGGASRAIWIMGAEVARVTGNVIRQIGESSWQGNLLAGIHVSSCRAGEVAGNLLTGIGPPSEHVGWVLGVTAGRFSTLDVRGNTVTLGSGGLVSQDVPLLIGEPNVGAGFLVAGLPLALVPWAYLAGVGPGRVVNGPAGGGVDPMTPGAPDLAVHGNALYCNGREPVALIDANTSVPFNLMFAENRCARTQGQNVNRPVVLVGTPGATIVSSNRVEGGTIDFPAIDLHIDEGAAGTAHCTVLGNITDTPIRLNAVGLAAPWTPLNIVA